MMINKSIKNIVVFDDETNDEDIMIISKNNKLEVFITSNQYSKLLIKYEEMLDLAIKIENFSDELESIAKLLIQIGNRKPKKQTNRIKIEL